MAVLYSLYEKEEENVTISVESLKEKKSCEKQTYMGNNIETNTVHVSLQKAFINSDYCKRS
jgi:hypothetical protein